MLRYAYSKNITDKQRRDEIIHRFVFFSCLMQWKYETASSVCSVCVMMVVFVVFRLLVLDDASPRPGPLRIDRLLCRGL